MTVYSYSSFSFTSSTGVVTSLSGGGAYFVWNSTCASGVPQGAYPSSSITLTGSTFVITFAPQGGGGGSATYTALATQTISFTAPTTPVTYGVSAITLSATASSGLAVAFTVVSGPATVSGSVLTITGAGTVVVAANQAGNSSYAAATQVTQSITVNKAVLTVTATNASRNYGVANPTFTDTVTGFVNSDTLASATSGAASLTTSATTVSAVGNYAITAATGTLTATNYIFTFLNGTLTVTKATPTITWATPVAVPTGTILSATQLDASAGGVAGSFIYTPSAGTVLSTVGSYTLSAAFTPTDTTDYNTPAAQTVVLIVNSPKPVITWPTPAAINFGTALSATQLNATSNVAGSFVYSPASGAILLPGTDTLSATFTPTNPSYATVTTTVSLVVNPSTSRITCW